MIKKRIYSSIMLITIAFAFPICLFAEAETHDGFYLNFQLGAGAGASTTTIPGDDDMELSGNEVAFRFKLGGAPVNNLIIYGVLGGFSMEDPDFEYGDLSGTMDDTTLSFSDFGIGLCYYFMPINIYISADAAAVQGTIKTGGTSGETDTGAAFTLSIGKEWWISDNWGLGVAAIFSAASMDDKGEDAGTVNHRFIGIAFTATFN